MTSIFLFANDLAIFFLAPKSNKATFRSPVPTLYGLSHVVFSTTPVTLKLCIFSITSLKSSYFVVVIIPFIQPLFLMILVKCLVSIP